MVTHTLTIRRQFARAHSAIAKGLNSDNSGAHFESHHSLNVQVICLYLKNLYVMLCAIWYHLYNLKIVKNTSVGVLLFVKLQTEAK